MILTSLAVAVCVAHCPLPLPVRAMALEASGQWKAALDYYLPLHATQPNAIPDLAGRIKHCLRRSSQQARIRDDQFQKWSNSLTLSDALQLYHNVLDQLNRRYVDGSQSTPRSLFAHGLLEFERAIADSAYRDRYLPISDLPTIRHDLETVRRNQAIQSIADARYELRDFVVRIRSHAPRSDAVAIVLQFLFGACAGLDEWTTLQTPNLPLVESNSVMGVMLTDHQVGYLRITEFTHSTASEFDAAIAVLGMQGMKSLVVDLRGNPGGLLAAGIEVSKRLLPNGVIVRTDGRDPAFAGRVVSSQSGMTALRQPLVILVDGATISTAEVVATAIQANQRGRLVGMPTFGKGTVQASMEVKAGGKSVLILTVAKLLDANGLSLVGQKTEPDIREPDPDLQLKTAISEAHALASMRMP
jgi:hypothetical protein